MSTLSWSDRSPESLQVWVSRYASQPHTPPSRPHTHTFFELLFVEAGEGWHSMGERQVWAQAGDLFVMGQIDKTLEPELLLPKCSAQSRPLLTQVFRFIEANYCQPIGLSMAPLPKPGVCLIVTSLIPTKTEKMTH